MKISGWLVPSLILVALSLADSPGSAVDEAEDGATPPIGLLSELSLPADLARPRDVRWLSSSSLLLTTRQAGLVEVGLSRGPDQVATERPRVLIPVGSGRGELLFPHQAAVSETWVATSSFVFTLAWRPRDGSAQPTLHAFSAVIDFDLRRDQAVILGGRRDERGVWCPDGAIAWRGHLSRQLEDLQPLYFSRDGRGAPGMGRCGDLGLGAIRFLGDGSIILVPGVEDGVYLYGPSGEMVRTWSSEDAGFFTGCPLSDKELAHLSVDERRRFVWLDQRPVLDDILPLGADPALVIRRVDGEVTRWELVVLRRDGRMDRFALPFTSAGPHSHVRGDLRDGRMVFVMYGGMDYKDEHAERKLLIVEAPA